MFLLDEQGCIVHKRFPQSYRERETGVAVLERGFGLASSVHGTPAHARGQGVRVAARLDSPTYRAFQRLWLTVDIEIDAGLHVYGQPIPDGYVPLTVEITHVEGRSVGAPELPPAKPHRFEGLDEAFHIYEGKLTVTLPLTFVDDAADTTVEVVVRYQACSDDLGCLMPQTVTLQVPARVQDHIDRPRQR